MSSAELDYLSNLRSNLANIRDNIVDVLIDIDSRIRELEGEAPAGAQSKLLNDPVGDATKKLDWNETDYGAWAFRYKTKGSTEQTPDQKVLTDAIVAANGKLEVGGKVYTLPEGKPFINRKKATSK